MPGTADGEWHRLHPLSPVLRGGLVLIAVVGYALSQAFDRVFAGFGPPDDVPEPGRGGTEIRVDLLDHPVLAGLFVLAVVGAGVAIAWLSWRFSLFRVTPTHVELRTGVLFRQHRQVPLERVQAVEIGRPLLAQVLGLAQVVVQSAGGRDSRLKLAFLGLDRAVQMRDHLLVLAGYSDEHRAGRAALTPPTAWHAATGAPPQPAIASGTVTGPSTPPAGQPAYPAADHPAGQPAYPAADHPAYRVPPRLLGEPDAGRTVLEVPNGRLLVATLLHPATLALGVALVLGLALAAGLFGGRGGRVAALGALPAMVPVLIGVAASRVGELLKHGNFSMRDLGSSLRIQHGLTDRRTTTVPLHRVQAMEMLQPLWWRPFGWWRARVNVAGVQGDEDDPTNETAVLPVGTLDQALGILTLVDPRVAPADLERAALADGRDGGWLTSPRSARWLDPLSWRRNGYACSAECLLLRRGRLHRSVVVVPHARIQSMTVMQGPLERRLDLADVAVHSTEGPVTPVVSHVATVEAERLFQEQSTRASVARAAR